MRRSRQLRHAPRGPFGDASRHLPLDELERGFESLAPQKDVGKLSLIVARGDDGQRQTPERTVLSVDGGVPNDAWLRDCPDKIDAQITLMRSDVARLIANGQSLSLFGDNLLVDLDLSVANLPAGSRLRLGSALLEVTPEPHTGCLKFRQRFGGDAKITLGTRIDLRTRRITLGTRIGRRTHRITPGTRIDLRTHRITLGTRIGGWAGRISLRPAKVPDHPCHRLAVNPIGGSQSIVQVRDQGTDLGGLGARAISGVFKPRCCCAERCPCLIAVRVSFEYCRGVT